MIIYSKNGYNDRTNVNLPARNVYRAAAEYSSGFPNKVKALAQVIKQKSYLGLGAPIIGEQPITGVQIGKRIKGWIDKLPPDLFSSDDEQRHLTACLDKLKNGEINRDAAEEFKKEVTKCYGDDYDFRMCFVIIFFITLQTGCANHVQKSIENLTVCFINETDC